LASELAKYRAAIEQRVIRNWIRPVHWQDKVCVVRIHQSTSGDVIEVVVTTSSGDPAFDRSVEAAIFKASPLPLPTNPELFERDVQLTFRPQ
jgi:colicin import membrane protein